MFRLRARGFDNLPAGPCLIVANHVSLLDGPLLACCLPSETLFALDPAYLRKWWMRPFLAMGRMVALAPDNPLSLRALSEELRRGGKVAIFPEGRISCTGILMKLYDGSATVWEKGGRPPIVAAHISGGENTRFGALGGKRLFAAVSITLGAPFRPALAARKPKDRRAEFTRALADEIEKTAFAAADAAQTLPQALVAAARENGFGKIILADGEREMSARGLLRAAAALAAVARDSEGDNIGVLLPTSIAGVVSFFAVSLAGKTPVMLNFTAGEAHLLSACRTAGIRVVWSSRRFLQAARLESAQAQFESAGVRLLALEDARGMLSARDKLRALAFSWRPRARAFESNPDARKAAVLLFTSGSEGEPKGVSLSHRNLLANYRQTALRLEILPTDSLLHTLPLFHSFGLFAAILGVLRGIRTRLYPTPLNPRAICEIAYHENISIFFSANAFLARYGQAAHPHDFRSLRLVVAGAEKLATATRALWRDKFGIRIFEGYGVTETAPVIAFNTPRENREGSVGRAVPGLETRLQAIAGVESGGRLFVRGDNVMMGYLAPATDATGATGEIEAPPDGWHDTGDIASIDEDGFLRIVGRAKRFAKVSGEMAPLGAIEEALAGLWPDEIHLAAAVAAASRGEEIVVVTTRADASREEAVAHFRARGLPALWLPRRFVTVAQAPLLPTGKPDYRRVTQIAAGE